MLKACFLFFLTLFYVSNSCALEALIKKLSRQLSALDTVITHAREEDRRIETLKEQLDSIAGEQAEAERKKDMLMVEVHKALGSDLRFVPYKNPWLQKIREHDAALKGLRLRYKQVDAEFQQLKTKRALTQKKGKVRVDGA